MGHEPGEGDVPTPIQAFWGMPRAGPLEIPPPRLLESWLVCIWDRQGAEAQLGIGTSDSGMGKDLGSHCSSASSEPCDPVRVSILPLPEAPMESLAVFIPAKTKDPPRTQSGAMQALPGLGCGCHRGDRVDTQKSRAP